MTICVAAICKTYLENDPRCLIVGAADRMLTHGDIEFEPQKPKIIPLTRSIFLMLAGDSALQADIMQGVLPIVNSRIQSQPDNWWKVAEVAEFYRQSYNKIALKQAAAAILAPLDLTSETFLARQRTFSPDFIRDVTYQLQNFALPEEVAAIICGIDRLGGHIYVARNATITCQSAVGFAAIGAGDWHSKSQFMFAKHTWIKNFPETLLLTYAAKKRAEVAPGVGAGTDMFVVGPGLGEHVYPLGEHVFGTLQRIYNDMNSGAREFDQKANKEISDFVDKIREKSMAQTQQASARGEGTSPTTTPELPPVSPPDPSPPPAG